MTRPYRSILSVLALGGALTFAACDNAAPEAEFGAPPPPPSAQVFDVSAMASLPAAAAEAILGNDNPGDNFLNAAARVAITTGAATAQLYIPFATTAIAQSGDVGFDNGLWTWVNTVPISDRDATFRLTTTARPPVQDPIRVDWKMNIIVDDNGDVTNNLLYEGFTDNFQANGFFTVYAPLNDFDTDVPVLTVEYDNTQPDMQTVRFESLTDVYGHPGDVATYEADAVNARFELNEPHNGNNHLVEWVIDTLAGRLVATDYNGGNPACWNEDLQDIPCP